MTSRRTRTRKRRKLRRWRWWRRWSAEDCGSRLLTLTPFIVKPANNIFQIISYRIWRIPRRCLMRAMLRSADLSYLTSVSTANVNQTGQGRSLKVPKTTFLSLCGPATSDALRQRPPKRKCAVASGTARTGSWWGRFRGSPPQVPSSISAISPTSCRILKPGYSPCGSICVSNCSLWEKMRPRCSRYVSLRTSVPATTRRRTSVVGMCVATSPCFAMSYPPHIFLTHLSLSPSFLASTSRRTR